MNSKKLQHLPHFHMSKFLNTVDDIYESKKSTNVQKTDALIAKCKKSDCLKDLDEVSLHQDDKGYFVQTHRATSKRYDSPEKIPIKDIKFIASTG